jgi:hypothetical protein
VVALAQDPGPRICDRTGHIRIVTRGWRPVKSSVEGRPR